MQRVPGRVGGVTLEGVARVVTGLDDVAFEGFQHQAARQEAQAAVGSAEPVHRDPLLAELHLIGHVVLKAGNAFGLKDRPTNSHLRP